MEIESFIQNAHPFLAGMSEAHLRRLARDAAQTHFPAGTVIFREGEVADRFYLIQRGNISLETHSGGHPLPIQSIGDNEVLGWSWHFAPYCWHFDARAERDTDAIVFHAPTLRAACEADKDFGFELMQRVARLVIGRLQATRLKLVQTRKPAQPAATKAKR
jgi:CRP-like cAMP-binding protein